jgi:glycosyltransferase involved in cell wall biosynthesis
MLSFLDDSSILDELDGATVVLDQHNDMERFWAPNQSHGTILKRFWAQWNISRIREHREDVLPMCDVILSVSQEDASSTRKLAPSDVPVWVVPNGVDVEHFEYERRKEQESTSNRILFVGSMDVEMNVDAVTWFVQAIFPEIRKSVPDATFVIVGRSPTSDVRAFGENEGVEVTGRVDDLRPYYERADVAIVPSRLGGGTKLKVPEAMAVGVPVVATSKGAQGLEIEDKKHLLIADSEEKFANAVVSLFENPDKASCLATAARERVEEKYSWTGIYDGVLDRIEHRMLRAK